MAKPYDTAGRTRRGDAVMDQAPRVEMGGKTLVIVGGNVSTIPAHTDDDHDEVAYEKGQPASC
jgi:hypothetical protein